MPKPPAHERLPPRWRWLGCMSLTFTAINVRHAPSSCQIKAALEGGTVDSSAQGAASPWRLIGEGMRLAREGDSAGASCLVVPTLQLRPTRAIRPRAPAGARKRFDDALIRVDYVDKMTKPDPVCLSALYELGKVLCESGKVYRSHCPSSLPCCRCVPAHSTCRTRRPTAPRLMPSCRRPPWPAQTDPTTARPAAVCGRAETL